MGYDPYDYYDLGEIDRKGGKATWFGSKADLLDLIKTAHDHGMQVYADMIFNHNSGGDAQEPNPIDSKMRWTRFQPESGQFLRDWSYFHPSLYEQWDGAMFGEMPDLCHRNPLVYTELIKYAKWMLENIEFDGFRYDMVKGMAAGWSVPSRNYAPRMTERSLSRSALANAGITTAQLRTGSMKPMHGQITL